MDIIPNGCIKGAIIAEWTLSFVVHFQFTSGGILNHSSIDRMGWRLPSHHPAINSLLEKWNLEEMWQLEWFLYAWWNEWHPSGELLLLLLNKATHFNCCGVLGWYKNLLNVKRRRVYFWKCFHCKFKENQYNSNKGVAALAYASKTNPEGRTTKLRVFVWLSCRNLDTFPSKSGKIGGIDFVPGFSCLQKEHWNLDTSSKSGKMRGIGFASGPNWVFLSARGIETRWLTITFSSK